MLRLIVAVMALSGCSYLPPFLSRVDDPAQSWDQENLKRNDHGCPTSVYIAPGGELEQCL